MYPSLAEPRAITDPIGFKLQQARSPLTRQLSVFDWRDHAHGSPCVVILECEDMRNLL